MVIESISREAAHGAALLSKSLEIALGEVELSSSQYRLLVFLSEAPAAATVLASRLDVSRPSLTALVDGLVARGLVIRESDPGDRRRVSHQISPAGVTAVERADAAIQARLSEIASNLPADDREVAGAGLERWHRAILAARAAKVSS